MNSIVRSLSLILLFSLAMSFGPISKNAAGARSTKDATDPDFFASAVNHPRQPAVEDFHSYANPGDVRVRHLDLEWDVLFDQKILKGSAVLDIERVSEDKRAPLILDTRDLNIEKVETSLDGTNYTAATFTLGSPDPILGAPLTIQLPERVSRVRINYSTNPGASGLQWLESSQTAGKKQPFIFTQSQAIHARSWIPLQDTPQVRVTYTARVHTPRQLLAVMSAENDPRAPRDGDYRFRMVQPIPSYLIALAVGDLSFRPLGPRTGVYAEPPVVDKAAREFADTEKMIRVTENSMGHIGGGATISSFCHRASHSAAWRIPA